MPSAFRASIHVLRVIRGEKHFDLNSPPFTPAISRSQLLQREAGNRAFSVRDEEVINNVLRFPRFYPCTPCHPW